MPNYLQSLVIALFTLFIFTACASYPQNSKDYRASFHNQDDGFTKGYETYTLERKLDDVTSSLKSYLELCLEPNKAYVPSLMVKKYMVELHLQEKSKGLLRWFQAKKPKDGAYAVVVDVYRNTADSVKVDFYKVSDEYSDMISDIKKWIHGNSTCHNKRL